MSIIIWLVSWTFLFFFKGKVHTDTWHTKTKRTWFVTFRFLLIRIENPLLSLVCSKPFLPDGNWLNSRSVHIQSLLQILFYQLHPFIIFSPFELSAETCKYASSSIQLHLCTVSEMKKTLLRDQINFPHPFIFLQTKDENFVPILHYSWWDCFNLKAGMHLWQIENNGDMRNWVMVRDMDR